MKTVSARLRSLLVVGAVTVAGLGVGAASASAATAPEPSQSASGVQAGSTATVSVDGLRLRSAPSFNGYTKGLLYGGDPIFVRTTFASSYNPDWVEVVLTQRSAGGLPYETRGYVWKDYLR
ncbi:hypothetical protein AB0I10_00315 [Streptomyces sp. NPDC050636]|uniref:hypothetical protein n=1 Tax=Streptomyces sp. NPDC050636 TaxID=3154510 RepID=UPI0034488C87